MSIEDALNEWMRSRCLSGQRTQQSTDEGFMLALSDNTRFRRRWSSAKVRLLTCLPLRADYSHYSPLSLSLP